MDVACPGQAARDIDRVDYADMGGFSPLFVDYARGTGEIGRFYEHGFDLSSLQAAARAAARADHADRSEIVRILADQQPLWGDDPAADANVKRLGDPEAVVIATGQQVGLFTGPTYTVLKALTTVILAKRLESESQHPVVPLFWLGSEDHDFAEMSETWLPGGSEPIRFHYEGPDVENTGPVGALLFDERIDALVAELEEALPSTEFRDEVVEMTRSCYREGVSFRDAFARLLRRLLPGSGLVIFAPDDERAKHLAIPLWRKEIQDWASSEASLRRATAEIESPYHAQVHIRPTNLFMVWDGKRLPIDVEGDRFVLRGTDESWTEAESLDLLDREPARFSPNVVTRPLTQDWLFPTAAYVAGPGETAYFGQYREVYRWADVPMPVIFPRVSVTFIEPGVRRNLHRIALPPATFADDPDAVFSRIARARMDFDVEEHFGAAADKVDAIARELGPEVTEVDASLARSLEATRAALRKEISRLRDRVLRADRRNRDQLRQRVGRIAGSLYPLGKPQERVLSPLYFAAKYGPDFFVRLMDDVDTDTSRHFLIDL